MNEDIPSASELHSLAWCADRTEAAKKGFLKTLQWLERQPGFQGALGSFHNSSYFKELEKSEKQRFPFELVKVVAFQLGIYQIPPGKRPKKSAIYTRTDRDVPLRDYITCLALTFKQKYGGYHRAALIHLSSLISDSDCMRTVDRVLCKIKSHGGDIKTQTLTITTQDSQFEFTLTEWRVLIIAMLDHLMREPGKGYLQDEWQKLPLTEIYQKVLTTNYPLTPPARKSRQKKG